MCPFGRLLGGVCFAGLFIAPSAHPPSRPIGRLLRVAFAGCFCAEWLRLALPQGAGQTWLAMFHSPPYLACPLGGAFRRGAPIPCPRRPAPPNSLRAAFAGCFIRGHHAARWAARGLPRSPRPLTPAPWARKRAPMLLRAALVGCFIRGRQWLGSLSLPSALWASARSFVPP